MSTHRALPLFLFLLSHSSSPVDIPLILSRSEDGLDSNLRSAFAAPRILKPPVEISPASGNLGDTIGSCCTLLFIRESWVLAPPIRLRSEGKVSASPFPPCFNFFGAREESSATAGRLFKVAEIAVECAPSIFRVPRCPCDEAAWVADCGNGLGTLSFCLRTILEALASLLPDGPDETSMASVDGCCGGNLIGGCTNDCSKRKENHWTQTRTKRGPLRTLIRT